MPYSVYENEIANLFAPCGGLDDIYLVKDRDTGDPKVNAVFHTFMKIKARLIYSGSALLVLARPLPAVVRFGAFFVLVQDGGTVPQRTYTKSSLLLITFFSWHLLAVPIPLVVLHCFFVMFSWRVAVAAVVVVPVVIFVSYMCTLPVILVVVVVVVFLSFR